MKKQFYCTLVFVFFLSVGMYAQAPNNAYGNNQAQVDLISSVPVFAIYSGDVNQDGYIDVFDFLDMDVDIQLGNSGYLATDLNGDGFVDIFDFLILDVNIQTGVGFQRPY